MARQGSSYLLQLQSSQAERPATPCYLNIDPPYELLLQRQASIVGPHSGKFGLALQELPGCTLSELTRIARGQSHMVRQKLCQLAVATKNCTQAMVVEYIAAAEDGWGRVYARQACAQQLPRSVRTMVYGSTYKEVDMSGAHCEIVRRLVNSSTPPPIHLLREQLVRLWQGHNDEVIATEIRRFPIRVINAGVASTLRHVAGCSSGCGHEGDPSSIKTGPILYKCQQTLLCA